MSKLPVGWNAPAHTLWQSAKRPEAIQQTLAALNAARPNEPRSLFVQLSYYAYLSGNYAESIRFAKATLMRHGPDAEIEKNTASALLRHGDIGQALEYALLAEEHATATPELLDLICSLHWRLDQPTQAIDYGGHALVAKDQRSRAGKINRPNPRMTNRTEVGGKANVVSFTVWGENPRYLRGGLRNALLMPEIYPGWRMRVYAATDVPADFIAAMRQCNVEIIMRDAKAPALARLAWRFEVANDKAVQRFLVRDIDSVISLREQAAVQAWVESEANFHVMRDWQTHTDLVLAGMWGGVAGLLPDIAREILRYSPRFLETPNIDQWFLGDIIWPRIAHDVIIHDRYYPVLGALSFPGPALDWPGGHVGQDEYATRNSVQAEALRDWSRTVPSLKLDQPVS
jgi:hypothetical protein